MSAAQVRRLTNPCRSAGRPITLDNVSQWNHDGFGSHRGRVLKSVAVAAGHDRLALGRCAHCAATLALLTYFKSQNCFNVCKFGQTLLIFVFMGNGISMELAKTCYRSKPHSLLYSIFQSFIGLCAKIWHWNKSACSRSIAVHCIRSKSTTCPWLDLKDLS